MFVFTNTFKGLGDSNIDPEKSQLIPKDQSEPGTKLRDFSDVSFAPDGRVDTHPNQSSGDTNFETMAEFKERLRGEFKKPGLWQGTPEEPTLIESAIKKISNILGFEDPTVGNKGISNAAKAQALIQTMAADEGIPVSEFRNSPEFVEKFASGFTDVASFGVLPAVREALTGEQDFAPDSFAGYAGKGLGAFAGLMFGPAKVGEALTRPITSRIAVTRDMPLAMRTLRQGFKEAIQLSPTIGASLIGEAGKEKSFGNAADVIVSGLESGAITGAIFGVSRGLFPAEVRHRAARIVAGLVGINAQRAIENPNESVWDRPASETIFDTAMDVFFMWRGLPKDRFLRFEKLINMIDDKGLTKEDRTAVNNELNDLRKEADRNNNKDYEKSLKVKVKNPPNPEAKTKLENGEPTHTFTSKKGNYYEKIGGKWYNEEGQEITNRFVVGAAERGKVAGGRVNLEEPVAPPAEFVNPPIEKLEVPEEVNQTIKEFGPLADKELMKKVDETLAESKELSKNLKAKIDREKAIKDLGPEMVSDIEAELGKPIEQTTKDELKTLIDKWEKEDQEKLEDQSNDIEEVEEPIVEKDEFRQTDPEITRQQRELLPSYDRIDNIDSLFNRIETDINSWLDGNDEVPIGQIKELVSRLNVDVKRAASGKETPDGILGDMNLAELKGLSEYTDKLDKWSSKAINMSSEVKLYDIGGAVVEGAKQIKKLYDKLTGRGRTRVLEPAPDPFTGTKNIAREIVRERSANLQLAQYETNKFINDIEQRLTPEQKDSMIFVIEKTGVPKEFNRPDIQKVIDRDKGHLENVAKEIKGWFDQGFKKVKEHIPDLSVKQIEDYVTHLYDVPVRKQAEAVRWFQTQNRLLERRFIDTYAEAIKLGYKPKTLDISEIIRIHDALCNRAIENNKYLNALLSLKENGMPLVLRTVDAPPDWVEVRYPALTRRIPAGKGGGKKGKGYVKEVPVMVHPDLVRPLKTMFEERFSHPILSAYEAVNGILKKSMLSISLFHHGALAEVGIALGIPAKTANLYFNPAKIYRALAKGEYDAFQKEELAKDAIEHGMQLGASADIPIGKIQGYLDALARKTKDIPLANRLTKFTANFNSVWDKALWSYLHDSLKLYGYESLVGKLDTNMDSEHTTMRKREIAQFVNDTFGGQNWDNLMLSPKEVQMMTWSLLSADWTLSTTRQALAAGGIGSVYNETKGLRTSMGLKFWGRAALFFGVGMNLLNAMFREWDMRENPQYYQGKEYSFLDKTMWGNTVGKTTNLFVGRYSDGSERYLRWGKQFRDFFELLIHPLQKIGGKAAPVPQLGSQIFTGHTLSGFKNDDVYGKEGFDKALGIFKTIAKSPLPLSVKRLTQDNTEFKATDLFMPSTKGMSRYAAVGYFKDAVVKGDDELLRDVYEGALRNNLPAFTLFNEGLGLANREMTESLIKTVKDIEDVKARMSLAETGKERATYGRLLGKLLKEKVDREAGIRLLDAAKAKARAYDSSVNTNTPVPNLPSRGVSRSPKDIRF